MVILANFAAIAEEAPGSPATGRLLYNSLDVDFTRRTLLGWPLSLLAARTPVPGGNYPVTFVDVARSAGLKEPIVYGGVGGTRYIVESTGCGVAFYDYDNDGWLDIFVLSGSRLEGFEKGKEPSNRLYKNNRDGTFTDVTRDAGLIHSGWASAVCIGDYDNDGNDDLFVTYWGENVLYHNNGDGTFTDVTGHARLGGDPKQWHAGCTFIDYDRDGKLDLFVSTYVHANLSELPLPGKGADCSWKGVPVYCGPRGLKGTRNYLFHNNGDGTFTDVSEAAGILKPSGYYGMTATTVDFNDDGWPDLLLICDSTPSILYRNNRNGTFTDVAVERGVAYSEDGLEQSGMGVAIVDYNGDGALDIVKTVFADDVPALYQNDGTGFFTDVSIAAGLQIIRHVQWGVGLVDFDNDTWPDLFYVTGHVYPEIERVNSDYPYKGPRALFRNLGNGKFVDATEQCGSGLTAVHSSRGCAFGDFDNDGDMDVLVMNVNEPPSLLRADVKKGRHWLKVKLTGTQSNRSAIGARVRVKCGAHWQAQQVESQSSYYSVNDFRLHFGLGEATKADFIEIRWPSGKTEVIREVAGDRLVYVQEGGGIVRATSFNPA